MLSKNKTQRRYIPAILITVLLCFITSCKSSPKNTTKQLTIFAAASTTELIGDIAKSFEEKYNIEVDISFASSSVLARQISVGAKADVFISANRKWVDYLDDNKQIKEKSAFPFLSNSLAVISAVDSTSILKIEKNVITNEFELGRLALGDPDHVPAGIYAKEALINMNLWEKIKDNYAPGNNVRAALAFVETGQCKFGIVYKTDAIASKKVKIDFLIPEEYHSPILYYIATTNTNNSNTEIFIEYLNSKECKSKILKLGFNPI